MENSTSTQKAQLERDGFLVLPQFVPSTLIAKAKRLANSHPHPDGIIACGKREDAVTDLWNKSMIPGKIKELLGGYLHEGKKLLRAQVALVLPGRLCGKASDGVKSTYKPEQNWSRDWHIDGLPAKVFHQSAHCSS
mmetsp:Transcript_20306/g.49835  ORF Transcript_20306/g.49835 Transcript_20306/m.49835 type:complete len:136 (-) Transcript_20306:837-1244(-)